MPTPSQPDRLCISARGVPLQNSVLLRTRNRGPRVERERHAAGVMSGMAAFVVLDVCQTQGEAANRDAVDPILSAVRVARRAVSADEDWAGRTGVDRPAPP
jgi:hypothetical protein